MKTSVISVQFVICVLFILSNEAPAKEEDDRYLADAMKWFNTYDRDNDGKISTSAVELALIMAGCFIDDDLQTTINTWNTEDNGYLSKKEFEQLVKYERAFRQNDADNDGSITRKELCEAMALMGKRFSDEETAKMMEKSVGNRDGLMNFRAFVQMMATEMHSNAK